MTGILQPFNHGPAATDDFYNVDEDSILIVSEPGVLLDDEDADGDFLSAMLVSGPAHGTLTFDFDGSFIYTPEPNFIGSDSFRYNANDGTTDSNIATVHIVVDPINDTPTLTAINRLTGGDQNAPVIIHYDALLTASDAADVDNDSLSFMVDAVISGTLTKNGEPVVSGTTLLGEGESLVWTPDPDAHGLLAAFTVRAFDGILASTVAVPVAVLVNNAPVAEAGPDQTANEGDAIAFNASASFDLDGDPLTYSWDFGDGHVGSGINFTHIFADNGTYTVTLKVTDIFGGESINSLKVTVNNVAPVANFTVSNSGVRGQQLSFAGSFTDPGTLDTHQVAWEFGDGTVSGYQSVNAETLNAKHVYTSAGTYTVKLTVRDDDGGASTVTKQVTIKAVDLQNDPCDPTKTALVVGGTNGDDKIRFVPQGNNGEIKVLINGVSQGIFKPTGRIIAYGFGGNDDIEVAGNISLV